MRSVALASLVILSLVVSPALAARHPRYRGAGRNAAAQKAAFLQQFDANGDGQLDPTERQAAVTALHQMKHPGGAGGKGTAAGGKNPGKLSDAKKQELIKRFDKDGDGKLDASEREAAKQAIEKLAADK